MAKVSDQPNVKRRQNAPLDAIAPNTMLGSGIRMRAARALAQEPYNQTPSINIQGPKQSNEGPTNTVIDPWSVVRGEVFIDAVKI
jgi:hypothetical protein